MPVHANKAMPVHASKAKHVPCVDNVARVQGVSNTLETNGGPPSRVVYVQYTDVDKRCY